MTLGELGSNILDISEQAYDLGLDDKDIQSMPIVDNTQLQFAGNIKEVKKFTLHLIKTDIGFVVSKQYE